MVIATAFRPAWFGYRIYLSSWRVWLASVPAALLRVVHVLAEPGWVAAVGMEVAVEGLRVVLILTAIARSKDVPLSALKLRNTWQPRQPVHYVPRGLVLEACGYAAVVGTLNLLVGWVAGQSAAVPAAGFTDAQLEAAVTLGLKNVLIIPVSVIVLLRILRLIP